MVGVICQLHTDCSISASSFSHYNITGLSWSCQSLYCIYPSLSTAEVSISLQCVIQLHATSCNIKCLTTMIVIGNIIP